MAGEGEDFSDPLLMRPRVGVCWDYNFSFEAVHFFDYIIFMTTDVFIEVKLNEKVFTFWFLCYNGYS